MVTLKVDASLSSNTSSMPGTGVGTEDTGGSKEAAATIVEICAWIQESLVESAGTTTTVSSKDSARQDFRAEVIWNENRLSSEA